MLTLYVCPDQCRDNSCGLYAHTKHRGHDSHKRQWAIEMNEARDLYLNTYGGIGRMDHLIKNSNMHYQSWKYWHSAMAHAMIMAVVVAYNIYLECCTGDLMPSWKNKAGVILSIPGSSGTTDVKVFTNRKEVRR